jgi:thioredoxin 1
MFAPGSTFSDIREEILQMADSKAVQQIGDADFDNVLNGGKPVFVDFWAPWCGPCRLIGPIVEELAPSYEGKAVITKMNVDDNPMVAQRYGVTSIPTLMMFKNGQLVDRMVGAAPKNALQQFIDRNL